MPLLTAVRDSACAYLGQNLPAALRVEAFAGVLDFDRLSPRSVQYSDRASLFVAVGGLQNVGQMLDLDCEASFWAFAVCRNGSRPTLAVSSALSLAQAAALAIHGQTFGLAGLAPALVRHLAPLEDDSLEKSGIWVWELMWTMRLTLSESI